MADTDDPSRHASRRSAPAEAGTDSGADVDFGGGGFFGGDPGEGAVAPGPAPACEAPPSRGDENDRGRPAPTSAALRTGPARAGSSRSDGDDAEKRLFGRLIVRLRIEADLSYRDLSQKVGLSRTVVYGHEKLGRRPSGEAIEAYAKVLGVKRRDLALAALYAFDRKMFKLLFGRAAAPVLIRAIQQQEGGE